MGRRWRNRRRRQRALAEEEHRLAAPGADLTQPTIEEIKGVPDTSPEVIEFLRWLKNNGFRNEHRLQVFQYGPGQGRGIATMKHSLAAGDELMLLPVHCMMLPSVLREQSPELYEHFEIDEDCLIAALLYERGRMEGGLHSFWAPYLNLIPRDYGYLPLLEPSIHQRCIINPVPKSYYHLVNSTLLDMERTRGRVEDIIHLHSLPIIFDPDRFNWAYCVVNTRSVHPNPSATAAQGGSGGDFEGDDIALVPFFDLFNHAPFGNAQVETVLEDGFKMVTHKPFPKYSQVYINYHENVSNREYYVYYGFTQIRPTPPPNSSIIADARLLRVSPCPQDIVYIPYKKLESILLEATKDFPEYRYLQERIRERLNMLVQMNFILPQDDVFHLRWPRSLLLTNLTVQFLDCCITLEEEDGKSIPCPDLSTLNSNVDASLEILFSLLSKTKFENVRKRKMCGFISAAAAVSRYRQEQTAHTIHLKYAQTADSPNSSPPPATVCFEEELSIHYSLKKMLLRGLLKAEYGFDATIPLTPVIVNQYMKRLICLDGSLKQVFQNELGLLLFHSYQIEQTMPC